MKEKSCLDWNNCDSQMKLFTEWSTGCQRKISNIMHFMKGSELLSAIVGSLPPNTESSSACAFRWTSGYMSMAGISLSAGTQEGWYFSLTEYKCHDWRHRPCHTSVRSKRNWLQMHTTHRYGSSWRSIILEYLERDIGVMLTSKESGGGHLRKWIYIKENKWIGQANFWYFLHRRRFSGLK